MIIVTLGKHPLWSDDSLFSSKQEWAQESWTTNCLCYSGGPENESLEGLFLYKPSEQDPNVHCAGSAWAYAVWQCIQGRLAKANLGKEGIWLVPCIRIMFFLRRIWIRNILTTPRWGERISSGISNTGQLLMISWLEKALLEFRHQPDRHSIIQQRKYILSKFVHG